MKTELIFNSDVHFLGRLCNYSHGYDNTGKSVRYIKNRRCVLCDREKYYKYRDKILSRHRSFKYKQVRKEYKLRKKEERLLYAKMHQKFIIPISQEVMKERQRHYQREYYHNVKKHKPKYLLNSRMSALIRKSLKNTISGKGGMSWIGLVDYTFEQLTDRLISTLPENATWQDFLDGELNIDHIIPRAVFNFDSYENIDFKRCWALDNLQLMWRKENQQKGMRITKDFQPSLCL